MERTFRMKYSDMINQIESFKYSSNLKYDLSKDKKMIEYIPTKTSLGILKDIFNDITQSIGNRQASRLIYGVYGTGKSSLLTVLASILNKTASKEAYSQFLNKTKLIDNQLAEEINSYLKDSNPYLIVPVDGYFEDFYQCIYYSITRVLEQENIYYNLQEPYNEATKIMEKWADGQDVGLNDLLNTSLRRHNIDVPTLVRQLSVFNPNALEIFKSIFSSITHGIEFRPKLTSFYENLNIINETILKSEYRGMVFIFDEFGKYLEDNIANVNVKAIQDLAEYCDHGQFNNSLILVSHKEILQYVDRDGLEEWEKVQSRFRPISFEQNDEEIAHLIGNALTKREPLWTDFKNKYERDFEKIIDQTLDLNIFSSLPEKEFRENIVYGIYPLHPVIAKMLIMLSKKIAQNERTIFTFIAEDEHNSLGNFLNETGIDKFSFIDAATIYDYFAQNVLNNKTSHEFSQYLKAQSSINKLKKKDKNYAKKIRIIKAIGTINLINNYDSIRPDEQTIVTILDEGEEVIKQCIKQLLQEKIIIYSRRYKYYSFFDASNIDIEHLIDTTMEKSSNILQAVDLLNDRYLQIPVLPDEYNYEYKMIRYYYPVYVLDDDLVSIEDFMEKNYYDGLIVYVLTNKDKEDLIHRMNADRSIYVYRKESRKILKEVKKLIAIEYLLTQKKDLNKKDPKAILELKEYKKELDSYIRNYVLEWNDPAYEENIFIADGVEVERQNIETVKELSSYMSNQLFSCFNKTLIVNNELINKNKLSNAMTRARKEIIDVLLLSDELKPSLGYKDLSVNHTFIRSLLELNGILNDNIITIPESCPDNDRIKKAHYVMKEIDCFIKKCETEEMNFNDIVNKLKSRPYGLRDGYIPVLLAAALRKYRHNTYIRLKGADQQLNGELFESIIRNPINYTLAIDHWLEDEENYIMALEKIFGQYINPNVRNMGRLNALHEAMQTHYKSIPKFGRTTTEFVCESVINYRKIIEKETLDYKDFFFNRIASLGENYDDTLSAVTKSKKDLEIAKNKLLKSLIKKTRTVFRLSGDAILGQLINLINHRWKVRTEESLGFLTTKFIDVLIKLDKKSSDADLIERLGLLLTGFEIGYWSDNQVIEFSNSIKAIYAELEKPENKPKNVDKSIKIILEDESGRVKRINFDKEDLSENGQILKNILLSNINNFGQALDHENKRQVIYEVLMRYI